VTTSVRPMTPEQEAEYLPQAVDGFVLDIVRAGSLDPARARAKAEASYASLHADGETYLAAYDADGVWVGVLGYALQGFDDDPATEPALFVYDLEVFEPYRRRGHARDLLAHAESLAREAGALSVRLTVWEGNDGARELYQGSGFRDERHQMRMPLEGTTDEVPSRQPVTQP